jgi:hypothetical protein
MVTGEEGVMAAAAAGEVAGQAAIAAEDIS